MSLCVAAALSFPATWFRAINRAEVWPRAFSGCRRRAGGIGTAIYRGGDERFDLCLDQSTGFRLVAKWRRPPGGSRDLVLSAGQRRRRRGRGDFDGGG